MLALYRLAARWPLSLLHALGAALGWLSWLASPTYRRRLRDNAALAGYGFAQVRPAVAQDGGDITFHGFDRGVVYLHMKGACAGCPSSTLTLKMGIENLLRHYIPEVTEVRQVAA